MRCCPYECTSVGEWISLFLCGGFVSVIVWGINRCVHGECVTDLRFHPPHEEYCYNRESLICISLCLRKAAKDTLMPLEVLYEALLLKICLM